MTDLVVGGGVAGLVQAWRLQRAGHAVRVIEGSSRAGGQVETVSVQGARIEHGPQTLRATPAVLDLIDGLDLRDAVVGTHPAARQRFILRENGLVPLSPRFPKLLPGLTVRSALRALAEPLAEPSRWREPESLAHFVARRFGHGVVDTLLDPFVAGVSGGDPRALDAEAFAPALCGYERAHGGVMLGALRASSKPERPAWAPATASLSFRDGMGTLVDRLARELGDSLVLNELVEVMTPSSSGWRVSTASRTYEAARVWFAAPLALAARLLDAPDLAVPSAPIVSVHLGWPTEAVPAARPGFGWLAPSSVRRDVLGVLWLDALLPGLAPGRVLRRVMLGGARDPDALQLDDAALIARARAVLADVEGLADEPDLTHVHRTVPGIPQAPVGHARRVRVWQQRWPQLHFVGWGVDGVGVSHIIGAGAARGDA